MTAEPKLYVPKKLLKLDLACGQTPEAGFEGVDLRAPNAQHKVDLFKFPFPWEDSSVEAIHCSHFAEHIPAREVEERDLITRCPDCYAVQPKNVPEGDLGYAHVVDAKCKDLIIPKPNPFPFLGQDFLFAFFDECHRILTPGGIMKVIVPCGRSNRGFWDPTHRRFFMAETFLYLSKAWLKANNLDHYNVRCDFEVNVVPTIPMDLSVLHDEVQSRRINTEWNAVYDWHATLKAIK